jgi:hypothetical protein
MDETRCERAHKGSIDANAGPQVPCNPASSLERATGIEPATSSLGISFRSLTECHFITSSHPVGPGFSRFVIPSHAIWAASWAAGAERRVTLSVVAYGEQHLNEPWLDQTLS